MLPLWVPEPMTSSFVKLGIMVPEAGVFPDPTAPAVLSNGEVVLTPENSLTTIDIWPPDLSVLKVTELEPAFTFLA